MASLGEFVNDRYVNDVNVIGDINDGGRLLA